MSFFRYLVGISLDFVPTMRQVKVEKMKTKRKGQRKGKGYEGERKGERKGARKGKRESHSKGKIKAREDTP